MATRSLFVPVDTSTVNCPFFLFHGANDFLFIYNTHTVLVFPLNDNKIHLKKCYINQNNWEKKQLETRAINRWKVHSKMSAKWSFLCFHIYFVDDHVVLLANRIRWLYRSQSQEKRAKEFCLFWPVLFSWMVNTLDPCFDDDTNNSLYLEIIDKNWTSNARFVAESCRGKKDSKPTWVMFTAKVRNNTSQSH